MDPRDFQAPNAGRVIKTPTGYHAFVPAPLPPPLEFDAPLVLALSRADTALSELSGLGRLLPNPHLLIAPYMRREAVLSSRIEGTQATLEQVLIDEAQADLPGGEPADLREVRNYIRALEHSIARLDKLPLSLRLIREAHAQLMRGVRGDRATPGEFRRSQNWIGPQGSTPETAVFVPPPPVEMLECLDAWERHAQERDRLPDLVHCALLHAQFETIHPFLDGNGRIGRLLVTLFMVERGRLSQPLLYLSAYIDEHKRDYYELLQRTRTHGDWRAWIMYFLDGVTTTARDAVARAGRLNDLREKTRRKLGKDGNALALLDALLENPFVTAGRAAKLLDVSNPTARKAIRALEGAGLLREVSRRRWGQVYKAEPVMRILRADAPKD